MYLLTTEKLHLGDERAPGYTLVVTCTVCSEQWTVTTDGFRALLPSELPQLLHEHEDMHRQKMKAERPEGIDA